jgi:hypothetical protein
MDAQLQRAAGEADGGERMFEVAILPELHGSGGASGMPVQAVFGG